MPGSSKSMSFSDFAPVSSLDSVQESESSSSKSKGREVAQAMLAEVEEHLKEFDRDLQALHTKAPAYQGSWSDIPLGSAEISSPASHETCMGGPSDRPISSIIIKKIKVLSLFSAAKNRFQELLSVPLMRFRNFTQQTFLGASRLPHPATSQLGVSVLSRRDARGNNFLSGAYSEHIQNCVY